MNIHEFADELEFAEIGPTDEDRMTVLLDMVEEAVVGREDAGFMAAAYAARLLKMCRDLQIDAFEVLQFVETEIQDAADTGADEVCCGDPGDCNVTCVQAGTGYVDAQGALRRFDEDQQNFFHWGII